MNILHINSGRRWIGEAAHTFSLVQLLAARGHHVVCAHREGSDLGRRLAEINFPRLELHLGGGLGIIPRLRDMEAIRSTAAAKGIDVIHVHRGREHWLAAITKALFRLKRPIVRTRHVVMPTKKNLLNRWLFRRTAKVICVSKAVEKVYRGLGIVDESKITRIYPGIDVGKFALDVDKKEILDIADARAVVGIVAQLKPIKGHDVFVEAARMALERRGDILFLVIGEGARRAAIEAKIAALGLGGRVKLLGHRADATRLMRAFDVGVLASTGSEGFSRATLEYMASGLPVVGTDAGAVPELIEDGVTGFIVKKGSAGEMCERILRLVDDPTLAKAMGERGRERAARLFNTDAWVEQTLKVYEEVLR